MQSVTLVCAIATGILFAGTAAAEEAVPPPPAVVDPSLASLPPASRVLTDWHQAVDYARARSVDLRVARLEVARAEAQSRIALAGMLPTATGNGFLTHNFITQKSQTTSGQITSPPESYANGSIVLNQPIVNLRALNSIQAGKVKEEIASASLEESKRQLMLGIAQAIVSVVTAERISELNRSGLRSALERLELSRQKQALGAATGLDVLRAEQDVASARATLVSGDESTRQTRESLGLALGFAEPMSVPRDISVDGLESTARAVCRPVRLEERSDFRVTRGNVEAARRQVQDARSQFLPTLNLGSTVAGTTADTGGSSPNVTWNIQGILQVPIWDGGARYGSLRDANAQVDEAQLKLESLRRTATVQLSQSERNVAVSEEKRKVAEESRNLARATDDLTRKSYLEGRGTSLELVTAAASLRDAEISLALREFELVQARLVAILQLAACDI
jgi:outer membrane protein TolC